MESITCKNCSTVYSGKYCIECGQKASTKRITMSSVFYDSINGFVAVDRGVWPTVRDMLIRPGHTLRAYIAGERAKYLNPGRFVLSVVAVSYIIFFVLFPQSWEEAFAMGSGFSDADVNNKFVKVISEGMSKNYTLMSISMIPFLGFWMWVFFRRGKFNLAEHLTAMTFITAMISLLPLPFMVLARLGVISGTVFLLINLFILIVYTQIAYINFVQPKSKLWAFIKITIAVPIGNVFWIFSMLALATLWSINTGKLSREDFLNPSSLGADSTGKIDSVFVPMDSLQTPLDSVQASEFR